MPVNAVPNVVLVIKVLPLGRYGEGYAVGAVAAKLQDDGLRVDEEFFAACAPEHASRSPGAPLTGQRLSENLRRDFPHPKAIRAAFWPFYLKYHQRHYTMAAENAFPVEHRFMMSCFEENSADPEADLPHPFVDLQSARWMQGKVANRAAYPDSGVVTFAHPLDEARNTARMLYEVYSANVLLRMMERDKLLVASILLQKYNQSLTEPDAFVTQSRELVQLAMYQRTTRR